MTLALRKFEKRDIQALFDWFGSEREVLQWAGAGLSWPLQRREVVDLIKHHRGPEPRREVWAITRGEEMIGHAQIGLNRRLRTAGLGRIAVAPSQRGNNLSSAVLDLIVHRAFSHDWVHRTDLLVYTHNIPAIRAYERAGFVLEGTRRETTPIGDEVWDTHVMSLLRHEFDKRTERE